ncbi:MAG: TonB-dependent receptor [Bacteroidetes bacterium]|nr:TonB-dependent receptor [Bacteroidota bacterium]
MQSVNIHLIKVLLLIVVLYTTTTTHAQSRYSLTGTVTDEYNHPLNGAAVVLENGKTGTATDRKGNFRFYNLEAGSYVVNISFLGYKNEKDTVYLNQNKVLSISLTSANKELTEVTVMQSAMNRKSENPLATELVNSAFVREHLSGSLMQTLSRLPGVSSMDIGAGQSKPVIRGLGFNRVVVAENGIKHEAQEWGADHGLEIDQFTVERVEVIKGPASLMYGANAIGGVIDLKQISTPAKKSAGGSVLLNAQTNNNLYGASAKLFKRNNHFYFKTHITYTDYSDYRVPTDSISYMTYYFKLKNNRLRNTAGRDRNGSLILGYLGNQVSTHLSISDNFSKSGFFANAHGLEIRNSTIDYDKSNRDIDLPSQQVNHLKILSNTSWMITDYKLNIDLGYQNNYRQEFSEAVAHGYMPVPKDSLERLYNKNTLTANVKLEFPIHNKHQFTTGLNFESQNNSTGGWGFILPAFSTNTSGVFIHDNIRFSEVWSVNAGLRYDLGNIHTDAYYDWYLTPQDNSQDTYMQRASELKRSFGSFSWGVGAIRKGENTVLKMNIGKSFRTPTAKELSSNGINYHMYRFEKGDTTLRAEESYQLDLGLILKRKNWNAEITPFVNYFPNYIYLNPTSDYYEAQQVYYYSQSQVFRTGGELLINYNPVKHLSFSVDAEYIYSVQLSGAKKGYTIPFSPPLTSNIGFKYSPDTKGIFNKTEIGIDLKLVADQNNRVPPEKKTAGYSLISVSAGTTLKIGKHMAELNLQLNNALNTRYYDHTSFYRLIEVPGQGRNLILTVQVPFGDI